MSAISAYGKWPSRSWTNPPAVLVGGRRTAADWNPDKAPGQHLDYQRTVDTADLTDGVELATVVDLIEVDCENMIRQTAGRRLVASHHVDVVLES